MPKGVCNLDFMTDLNLQQILMPHLTPLRSVVGEAAFRINVLLPYASVVELCQSRGMGLVRTDECLLHAKNSLLCLWVCVSLS